MTEQERLDRLRANWQGVQARVAESCAKYGRNGQEVTILGVTKYVDVELTRALMEVGCRAIAESRPQSLWQKRQQLQDHPASMDSQWHLIGHLQRNKVKRTLSVVDCIQTVDSMRLAEEIEQQAGELGKQITVLLEINISQDSSKTGLAPSDVMPLVDFCAKASHLELVGLMGMSTLGGSESSIRSEFASLRILRDSIQQKVPRLDLRHLSMGMSGDFEQAIAEGATMVRIGSALFEGLE